MNSAVRTTFVFRIGVFLLVLFVLPRIDRLATGDDADPSWQEYRQAVQQHAALLRYYTFEDVTVEKPLAQTVAGQAAPLTYGGSGTLEIVAGSVPGRQAVRLDDGWFEAVPFSVTEDGFTVEIRFRKHGQGSELGNGRTNGMLLAVGDGYWTGFRLWTDYPHRRLRFEIGRPKPNSAIGMMPTAAVPDGVWHHLAATWDGQQMRLYLNGILLQAIEFAGPYTPPPSPLRIGFAGAGIGSLRLDVDELVVYREALAADEVLQHAVRRASLPPDAGRVANIAADAIARQDWDAARQAFEKLVELASSDIVLRATARLGLAQVLQKQHRVQESIAECNALFDDPSVPPQLRGIAARKCLPAADGVPGMLASVDIYRFLLEQDHLTGEDQIQIRLCLAERLLRAKQPEAARQQYQAVLEMADLTPHRRWNVRLQQAHSFLVSNDFAAARAAYAQLAADEELAAEYRGNAALCVAHAFAREGSYAAAATVLDRIQARTDLPAHLRAEAAERRAEMLRLERGLPRRDPAACRVRVPAPPEPSVTFYVAPRGDDNGPGTSEQPFATLQRARDAIRAVRPQDEQSWSGATVYVRGGSYRVSETLELSAEDSGTPEAPITYRAAPGQTPVFSGGVPLDRFQPITDSAVRDRLPESVRDEVMQVRLADCGITDFGSIGVRGFGRSGYPTDPWVDLYVDGQAMPLARWPNHGTIAVGRVLRGRFRQADADQPGQFHFDSDRPQRWAEPDEAWMFGAWGHLWEGRSVQVADLDARNRRVTTVQPSSYGYREGQPFYFFNVLEELDEPGQWYLDRRSGVLYLYPPGDPGELLIQFPLLEEPFVVMKDASHVTLRGLTFELGRGTGAVIDGGRENLLAGCRFGRLGGNGVVVRGGSGHGLLGCDIFTLGAGGVRVSGGDPKTLTPGMHFVENCHVYDFSRVDRVYAPAVHLDGVGHRVAHNLIHDSPHHGMRIEGYEHTIEFNEIHSVVYEFDDQAGLDMFGNPTYRGNVIRYNFWHHIGSGHDVAGQSGIRLDDMISAVLVYGNVFYRCAGGRFGGVQIHGGKDNIVDNNLFIDCKAAISFSPWGRQRWLERLGSDRTASTLQRSGIDISKPPYSDRYPGLAQMEENPDRNFVWRNLAVGCGRFTLRDRGVNELMDNHAFSGDPGFADPDRRDFTLDEDSPVYDRFGFRPIPFREIGLYQDEHRATWPAQHSVTPHYVASPTQQLSRFGIQRDKRER